MGLLPGAVRGRRLHPTSKLLKGEEGGQQKDEGDRLPGPLGAWHARTAERPREGGLTAGRLHPPWGLAEPATDAAGGPPEGVAASLCDLGRKYTPKACLWNRNFRCSVFGLSDRSVGSEGWV